MVRILGLLVFVILASGFPVPAVIGSGGEQNAGQENHTQKSDVLPPQYRESYEYYEVCGCTEKDLQCDLVKKAIKCSDGKKYDSVTNWQVSWDYDYRRGKGVCSPAAFIVTVDIVFRMPKWTASGEPSKQLREKWDAYVENLLLHEKGHRDRAVEAAYDLTAMIEALPPARTCSDLDKEVNRISRSRLDRLIADQEAYDRATNHGQSEGVLFP